MQIGEFVIEKTVLIIENDQKTKDDRNVNGRNISEVNRA